MCVFKNNTYKYSQVVPINIVPINVKNDYTVLFHLSNDTLVFYITIIEIIYFIYLMVHIMFFITY